MLCKDLDRLFRDILTIDELAHVDSSLNGIQVGDENKEIKKIAFAVDASVESFHRASEQEADMLFVHHGLLWSKQKTITGNLYKRIKLLIEADIVLYAVHLPLDKEGKLPAPLSLEEIKGKLLTKGEKGLGVLPFGPEPIQSIGIVSGGDPRSGLQAIDEGLDLFITGDASHELYHEALEGHLNVIFAGHYATEVWGIRQVAEKVKTMTECDVVMLDIPTGL
jgi:putative NIF3 family GTP cyclohydrolase 1 type 2